MCVYIHIKKQLCEYNENITKYVYFIYIVYHIISGEFGS